MKLITVLSISLVFTQVVYAAPLTEEQILTQADQRIEKYRKGSALLTITDEDGKTLPEGTEVSIQQLNHKFLFGCNIFNLGRYKDETDNFEYQKNFAELMNFATLPFYWWNYTRQEGQPDDARTDEIIRWCNANNIKMKGHPLAWNFRDPAWLPDNPQKTMNAQLERIQRCALRFKGDIDIWDVVNEAAFYDRAETKANSPKLTEAITQMGLQNFLKQSFIRARNANENATLIINDYCTDDAFIENVLSKLVDDKGSPMYDVIGIQSHMHTGYWGAQKTWQVCERFAPFGKPLHFTEVTLLSGKWEKDKWGPSNPQDCDIQADLIAEFYTVLFSHPAVEAITWWDFSDKAAWQGAPSGLLNRDMTPKPAYNRLKELIKNKWWTTTTALTDKDGKLTFKGFFGQYQITVKSKHARFSFEKQQSTPIVIKLN